MISDGSFTLSGIYSFILKSNLPISYSNNVASGNNCVEDATGLAFLKYSKSSTKEKFETIFSNKNSLMQFKL